MKIKVENETLKKLTSREAQNLGLFSIGCLFLRGEAKTRVKGYKTTMRTETEIHYTMDDVTVELIALDSKSVFMGSKMQDWCLRVKKNGEYEELVQPLFGMNFIR